mgnify:CR=1 FL=1
MAAAYETGSATDVNDLMSKIRIFLTTVAGYTEQSYVTESSGRRMHMSKNSTFFNFRSFVAETTPAGGTSQTGIFFNAGSGYSGASAWHDQSGVLKYNSNTAYLLPGCVQLTGSIVAYHIFYFSDTNYDVIYFFVESPAGTYQRMLFGRLDRSKFGTHWTTSPLEGMFYNGSQAHNNTAYSNTLSLFGENQVGFWIDGRPKGAVFGSVPDAGTPQWLSGDFSIPQAQLSPARVQCFDSIGKSGSIWLDTPNTFNSNPIQLPIVLNVTLDSAATLSNTTPNVPWCPVGQFPFLYWINLVNINPGSDVSISTDTYKCFPMRKKSDTWNQADPSIGTYRFGLAVLNP